MHHWIGGAVVTVGTGILLHAAGVPSPVWIFVAAAAGWGVQQVLRAQEMM